MAGDRQAEQLGRQVLEMLEARGAAGVGAGGANVGAPRPGRWLYGLAVGFAAGVLVATVVVPQGGDGDAAGSAVASEPRGEVGGTAGGPTPGGGRQGADRGDREDADAPDEDGGVPAPEVARPQPDSVAGGGGQDQGAGQSGPASTGGDGAGGAAGTSPTSEGGSPSPRAAATAAKGVTGDAIKLGILAPEENPRTGDLHEAYEAEIDRWRQEGLLPVHGRDVELVHYDYQLVAEQDGAPQRAACVDLAQEQKVFAVMAWTTSPTAAECLATEFETPVIVSVTQFDEDLVERAWPYFFHTGMAGERVLRNWPHWADELGLLEDRTIGLYYSDDSKVKAQIDEHFRPVLRQLGYSIAEEQAETDGQSSEAIAVQRFQAAGVDTIFQTATGTAVGGQGSFSRAAEAQGYRPRYLITDFESASSTADTAPTSYGWVPEQFDNAYAMTHWRRAETGAPEQEPVPPAGKECMDNYARYSGQRYDKSNANESGTWDAMQPPCDQGRAMIKALHEAGRGLSEMHLVRALETAVEDQPSGALADISFSSTSHDGADQLKANKGDADCFCWLQVQGFREPWVD